MTQISEPDHLSELSKDESLITFAKIRFLIGLRDKLGTYEPVPNFLAGIIEYFLAILSRLKLFLQEGHKLMGFGAEKLKE